MLEESQVECNDVCSGCHHHEYPQKTLETFDLSYCVTQINVPEVLFKHTTVGMSIFSTTSFTPFEVLVSMIVLQDVQVLDQSSTDTVHRVATKAPMTINNGCVSVTCQ